MKNKNTSIDGFTKIFFGLISGIFLLISIYLIYKVLYNIHINNTEILKILFNDSSFYFIFLGCIVLSLITFWYSIIDSIVEKKFKESELNSIFERKTDELIENEIKKARNEFNKKIEEYKKNTDEKFDKVNNQIKNKEIILDDEGIIELEKDLDKEYLKELLSIFKNIKDTNVHIYRRGASNNFGLKKNGFQVVRIGDNGISIKGLKHIKINNNERNDKTEEIINRENDEFKTFLEKNNLDYFLGKFYLSYDGKTQITVKNYNWIENKASLERLIEDSNFRENLIKLINIITK